jgi:hypothetical protein
MVSGRNWKVGKWHVPFGALLRSVSKICVPVLIYLSTYRLKSISVCENGDSSSRSCLPVVMDTLQIPIKKSLQIVDVPRSVEVELFLSRMEANPFLL